MADGGVGVSGTGGHDNGAFPARDMLRQNGKLLKISQGQQSDKKL
jgi:hypothetical protein